MLGPRYRVRSLRSRDRPAANLDMSQITPRPSARSAATLSAGESPCHRIVIATLNPAAAAITAQKNPKPTHANQGSSKTVKYAIVASGPRTNSPPMTNFSNTFVA